MGGLALLARAAGHRVTGCDANVYPPMSEQLAAAGIELIEGFDAGQVALRPDLYVIGNVVTRGNPLMEAILDGGGRFVSGPQWVGEQLLRGQWVLAVAGTHGKTTTSSMLAWILEHAGLKPGFLIGGVPINFGVSARSTVPAGETGLFVIEADEYDTAFFDKRSKFVHYFPRTAILNNLEYDHADIFADLAAIETQFHHLVRGVPRSGRLIVNGNDPALQRVLARGKWSAVEYFDVAEGWCAGAVEEGVQHSFDVAFGARRFGRLVLPETGAHNRSNALAAIAAARHVGVPPALAIDALARFRGVKRRMQVRGTRAGITVYDDFAHHPTAVDETLRALRKKHPQGALVAIFEPRSATACRNIHQDAYVHAFDAADRVILAPLGRTNIPEAERLDLAKLARELGSKARAATSVDDIVKDVAQSAKPGDVIAVLSNGAFGGIHALLTRELQPRRGAEK